MDNLFSLKAVLLLSLFLSFTSSAEEDLTECGNNEQALLLAEMIINDPEQERPVIRCNKLLTKVAEEKAKLMIEHGLVMHNLGGSPNERLRAANYLLPDYYGGALGNQVEAIAGGYSDADDVWEAFKNSYSHRQHLLGEHDFYREQDEMGVAFIKKWQSPHVEYWAVYLTKGFEQNQTNAFLNKDVPNKGTLILIEPSKMPIKSQIKITNPADK